MQGSSVFMSLSVDQFINILGFIFGISFYIVLKKRQKKRRFQNLFPDLDEIQ